MPTGTAGRPLLAGRYRVIDRLGSGGMAAVYLAHDERLERRVAVKRMHTAGGDEMDARRFEREAKIGASLSHPSLVSIFDTEQDDESVLLVMEYVEGETLGDLLARGAAQPKRALEIVRAVADALDHAHANGIVHRDIKPGNVLLGRDGSVKLADLGIAKAVERTEITGTGTVLGTPAYMAPEQLEGREIGPAVDVYALATMAFEMLTGRKARRGRTAVEIAHQVVNEEPPDPRDVNPDIPQAAADAIRSGMAKDPARRPRSAVALAAQLERAFRHDTGPPPAVTRRMERVRPVGPVPQARPARPSAARRRAAARPTRAPRSIPGALALLALALAAVVIALASGGDTPSERNAAVPAKKQKPKAKAPEHAAAPAPAPTPAPAAKPPAGVPKSKGKGVAEAQALQLEGYRALAGGDYKSAVKLSRKAVEAFPPGTTDIQYAYALFNLGKALRLDGHPEQAIPVLEARLRIPNQRAAVQRELDAARTAAGQ